jgi:hypothetical protein
MTINTLASDTPILLSAIPTPIAGGTRIDLTFNTAMAAGSGTITITDGAVQTVIDRVTGQPTMRVVGATDTHTVSAASASFAGTQVKLDVPGLLPGHTYSIVMGNGVLVSSGQVAFGGVRSTSQVVFSTPDSAALSLKESSIDASLLKLGGSLQATLTFSEAVQDLRADALHAPNATVSKLVAVGDGHTWLATLTPSGAFEAAGNVLSIDMSKVHDAAGRTGTGSTNVASYSVDTKGPAATIALDAAKLTAGHDIVATISFSEAVQSLDAAALQAGHASITNISKIGDGSTWEVTLRAASDTTSAGNVLNLDLGKLADLAGNHGSGIVASASYAVDSRAPAGVAITLDGSLLKAGGSVGVTFSFSEAIKDLPSAAISAPNATIGKPVSIDDGHTWTATLTATDPNTSSGNTISVDMGRLQDLNGNAGSGSLVSSASYAIDTVAPAVADIALHGSQVSANEGTEVVITFNEKVNLSADAIAAPNASLQGLHSSDGGLSWKALLRPTGSAVEAGDNKVSLDMSKVHDLAGNAGSGSALSSGSYEVDTKGPTATIALDGAELKRGGSIGMTITLSDKVGSGDLLAALSAQNATISELIAAPDGLTWMATLKTVGSAVSADNVVSLDLSKLHDAHGNAGAGPITSASYAVDNTVTAYVQHDIAMVDESGPYENDHVSNHAYQNFEGLLSEALKPGQILRLTFDDTNSQDDPEDRHYDLEITGPGWDVGGPEIWFGDGVHTIRAQVIEGAHSSAAFTQTFTIDTTRPTMLTSPDGATGVGVGDDLVFTFDEAMYPIMGEGYSVVTLTDAEGHETRIDIYDSNLSADRKTLTIGATQHHLQAGKDYTIELPENLTDRAGNSLAGLDPLHIRTAGGDTLAPSAKSAVAQVWSGPHGLGTEIKIELTFSEAVKTAAGLPVLHLNNGGQAVFDHVGEDGKTMVFKYVVGAYNEDDTGNLQFADNAGLIGHVSDLAGNLLDGAHINFSSLDNLSNSGYGSIEIDAHAGPAPGAPVLAASADTGVIGDNLTRLDTPALEGSGTSSWATVKLYEGGLLLATTQADINGDWSIHDSDWAFGHVLADGTHTLVVRQYDKVGNQSPASSALTLKVDSTIAAPTVALTPGTGSGSSDTGLVSHVATPTFTGSGEESAMLRLIEAGHTIGELRIDNGGTWALSPTLSDGLHDISVEQTDLAGNVATTVVKVRIDTSIDTIAPNVPATPALAASSDTGISDHDGITSDNTPTIIGTAREAGGTIQVFEGDTLLGTAAVKPDLSWSFTVGTQGGYPATLGEGPHNLTVRQVDAAGNRSDISAPLKVTVDSVAPTLKNSELEWNSDKHRFELKFSEKIVFASDAAIDVYDGLNQQRSHHTGNVMTNWTIGNDDHGVQSVLELSLGGLLVLGLFGHFYLKSDGNAIQDVAGNVAIIGTPGFDIPGILH